MTKNKNIIFYIVLSLVIISITVNSISSVNANEFENLNEVENNHKIDQIIPKDSSLNNISQKIIYVDAKYGNDDEIYDGLSPEKAKKTIKCAVKIASDNETIYIKKGTYYENNISITKNILIIGENIDLVIINGSNILAGSTNSIFNLLNKDLIVYIENITFIDGYYTSGGAISNNGILTLNNTKFKKNRALQMGGSINNDLKGNLFIWNSIFEYNISPRGGAIYNVGNLTILNTKFWNNNADSITSSGSNNGMGGAIHNYGGLVYIKNNSEFSFNIAEGVGSSGGAIYNSRGILTIHNSYFEENMANTGGAIYSIISYTQTPVVIINNTSFISNNAVNSGGIASISGILNITNSLFQNNFAMNKGGAIRVSGESNIFNTIFEKNYITSQENGGALYCEDSEKLNLKSSYFVNNSATNGGAIAIDNGQYVKIDSCRFMNNSASLKGGAIYNQKGNIYLHNNSMTGNSALNGIYIFNNHGNINNTKIVFIGKTITISPNSNYIIITSITDDQNNPIDGGSITLIINNKIVKTEKVSEGGILKYNFTVQKGINIISGFYSGSCDEGYYSNIFNGIVNGEKIKTNIIIKTNPITNGEVAMIEVSLNNNKKTPLINQILTLIINKNKYTAKTNSKGIAIFRIPNLPSGKITTTASFMGNNLYSESSTTSKQLVNKQPDLKILKIKRLGNNYKINIKNHGETTSKKARMKVYFKKGKKTYSKIVTIGPIKPKKTKNIFIKFFKYSFHKNYKKIAHINYDKMTKEFNYKNNIIKFKI